MRLRLAFEKALVAALAQAGGGVHDEFGIGGKGYAAVAGQIEAVRRRPLLGLIVGADLQMNQLMLALVMARHGGERFPINALFIHAQAAPGGFVLKNLVGQLVDARTGFAGTGVAGDEPAATELVAFPDQPAKSGHMRLALRRELILAQKPDRQNDEGNSVCQVGEAIPKCGVEKMAGPRPWPWQKLGDHGRNLPRK